MSLRLPECPFCGEEIPYFEAFLTKNKCAYRCSHCESVAKVAIRPRIFSLMWVLEIIAFTIFAFSFILGQGFAALGVILLLLLFAGFYAITPFAVRLDIQNKKHQNNFGLSKSDLQKRTGFDMGRDIFSN